MARNATGLSDDASDRRADTTEEPKKQKSRRPANTAFRQQRLKAWQPILTPKTVIPLFFIVGVIFAPIGGLLIYASSQVQEISIDYSTCNTDAPEVPFPLRDADASRLASVPSDKVSSSFNEPIRGSPPSWGRNTTSYQYPLNQGGELVSDIGVCTLEFELPNDIGPPVFYYYRLTNFYQNHRRYVSSLDADQLKGKKRDLGEIAAGHCDPLDVNQTSGKPFYPCGLIANSLFNDTFHSPVRLNGENGMEEYSMTTNGIAWSSDADLYGESPYTPDEVEPPPNWKKRYPNGQYNATNMPDLHTDYPLQVWMRTAGLPSFSKLALRNDHDIMRAGRYRLNIFTDFPVTRYGGEKSILISTRTVMGGKNPFLGIAYIVVGGICILLGAVFTATHLIKPRKLGDHTYLTWNNEGPSTATATGVADRHSRPNA